MRNQLNVLVGVLKMLILKKIKFQLTVEEIKELIENEHIK